MSLEFITKVSNEVLISFPFYKMLRLVMAFGIRL